MVRIYECPTCGNKGLKIDTEKGYKAITAGKPKDLPCSILCKVCKRKIKYAIVKDE